MATIAQKVTSILNFPVDRIAAYYRSDEKKQNEVNKEL